MKTKQGLKDTAPGKGALAWDYDFRFRGLLCCNRHTLNSRSGRRIPKIDLPGVWLERSHKEAEFAESGDLAGVATGASQGGGRCSAAAGELCLALACLPAEGPALAVVRQWRRPAAAAAAAWRAGDTGRSSSPGRDAGRLRPGLCSANTIGRSNSLPSVAEERV